MPLKRPERFAQAPDGEVVELLSSDEEEAPPEEPGNEEEEEEEDEGEQDELEFSEVHRASARGMFHRTPPAAQ